MLQPSAVCSGNVSMVDLHLVENLKKKRHDGSVFYDLA